jgi:hypothetical protein
MADFFQNMGQNTDRKGFEKTERKIKIFLLILNLKNSAAKQRKETWF